MTPYGTDEQPNGLPPRKVRQQARNKAARRKTFRLVGTLALLLTICWAAYGLYSVFHPLLFSPSDASTQPIPSVSQNTANDTEPAPTPEHPGPHQPSVPPNANEHVHGVRLMFVGDTMMDGNVANVMQQMGDSYPLSEFMPVLQQADLVVANLETAVGTSGQKIEKTYAFQTDPARFALFEPLKGRILFTLANNHGMDAQLEETLHHLTRLGYPAIGIGQNRDEAFRPFVTEINGVRLAILGASRVIPTVDWAADEHRPGMASAYTDEPLLSTVQKWRQQVDHVIVYMHWGKEREHIPDDTQQKLAQKLLDAGARLVIGAHPHVLQELRWTSHNQLVAFSLGNFVFTTSTEAAANDTVVLDVVLSKERIAEVRVWPGRIHFGLIRRLDADPEGADIRQRLDALSPTIRIGPDGKVSPLQ
ncbi:MAG: CapA family protein [Bacillota bacterium]|nr:hypothetical protein [Bacillota bacterium]